MRDKRAVAQEFQQSICARCEKRFVGQKCIGKPVHCLCSSRHAALWIIVAVKIFAGDDAADHLDAANFNHPVTGQRIKACCFRVKDNLAHST